MRLNVRRETAAAFVAAIVAGAIAGSVAGGAFGDDSRPTTTTTVAALPPGSASAAPRSPEAIYQSDSTGVVVITDQQSQAVPATPFVPAGKQTVEALGSGFVFDDRGDIITNEHV